MKKCLPAILLALTIFIVCISSTTVIKGTFSDGDGNSFTYHACLTEYTGLTPKTTGMNTSALSRVFDLENSQLLEELEIHSCPAAIYQSGELLYFCITINPETSGVLEYSPDVLSRDVALRIMNSIFEYPEA